MLLAVCTAALTGCGGGRGSDGEQTQPRIRTLAILYLQYAGQHRGQAPADEEAFKSWIQSLDSEKRRLYRMEDDVDELFVSPRDGQPYRVVYGVRYTPGPEPPPAIIYEQSGANGERMVAFAHGGVESVPEVRFTEVVPND